MMSARSGVMPAMLRRARSGIFRSRSSRWRTSACDTVVPATGRFDSRRVAITSSASVVNVPPQPTSRWGANRGFVVRFLRTAAISASSLP